VSPPYGPFEPTFANGYQYCNDFVTSDERARAERIAYLEFSNVREARLSSACLVFCRSYDTVALGACPSKAGTLQ
jgi:hypothetical protein